MRLEIVDNPPKDQAAHYRNVKRRLRRDAGRRKRPTLPPDLPVTKISWSYGGRTTEGNVIRFNFSPITIAQIVTCVCDFYKVSQTDLVSVRRTANLVYPRQVAMYLARELTPKSFPLIGKMLGDRDHTTAMYGWRRIRALMQSDERMADEIAILIRMIRP